MAKTALALSILLAAGATGAVLAQEQIEPPAISGTVESVDSTTRTVVLDNGQTYVMGDSADIASLRPGSRVDLNCDTNGASCTVVSSVPQNEVTPESGTEPSAGPNQGGGDTGTGTVPPSNVEPPNDSGADSGNSY